MDTKKTHEALGERLDWQWYRRDDRKVAAALAAGEEVDAVHPLDAGALLDGYWHFLDEIGVLKLMGEQSVAGCKRKALPVFELTALYHLKTLMGIESIDALPALLFSDPVAMSVLGANAELVRHGLTQRSQHRRTVSLGQPRTMDADVVGNFAALWSAEEAESFFNGVIAALAGNGAYGPWVRAVMDGSHLRTTPDFTFETEGWDGLKLLVWWDAFSGLPLSAKVRDRKVYEPAHVMGLHKQAVANLGGHSRIGEFVADRLYVDGKVLYAIDQEDIIFSVVAKEKMRIRDDALSMVAARTGYRQQRGKKEKMTKVVGLEGLTTFDDYNDPEEARHKNSKDYEPPTLNAVAVVRSERLFPKQGNIPWVLLTNGSVKQPLETYDRYDDRSLIENLMFREGKQGWNLERPPQRNEKAYVAHVFLTLAVYALATAYRARCESEDNAATRAAKAAAAATTATDREADEHRRPKEAIRHYRQRIARENKAKVWVRVGDVYGIFHLAELSILLGVRLREVPPEVGTREQVFRRYGLEPPS